MHNKSRESAEETLEKARKYCRNFGNRERAEEVWKMRGMHYTQLLDLCESQAKEVERLRGIEDQYNALAERYAKGRSMYEESRAEVSKMKARVEELEEVLGGFATGTAYCGETGLPWDHWIDKAKQALTPNDDE